MAHKRCSVHICCICLNEEQKMVKFNKKGLLFLVRSLEESFDFSTCICIILKN